jgi:hypothetical protein
MVKRLVWVLGAVVAGLAGCSSGEHMAAADQAIAQFRQDMQAKAYARIYAGGSEELRKSASEAHFAKVLGAINAKLGPVKSAERAKWNVNFHTQGTYVSLAFNTSFESGPGTEQFIFRVADGKAALLSYHVNSAALLLN